jgi:hypothetical protein
MARHERAEPGGGLLSLAAPLLVWAAHFLLSYCTAALHCAKLASAEGSLGAARSLILAYTAAALALVAWLGWRACTPRRAAARGVAGGASEAALDRERFMGFTTLLLACLSALAIVYGALVLAFVRDCR